MAEFVSRAGLKLEHALSTFGIDVRGLVCADLGSNVGGFVDCLLQHGADKVYAIEKGYGVLEWKLRKDPRVVVMERTNAMHVELPERVALVTIDVAWTRQRNILPAARRLVSEGIAARGHKERSLLIKTLHAGASGSAAPDLFRRVVTLIKPHYEADKQLLKNGILPAEEVEKVVNEVKKDIRAAGFEVIQTVQSPILGGEGNVEVLAELFPN